MEALFVFALHTPKPWARATACAFRLAEPEMASAAATGAAYVQRAAAASTAYGTTDVR
jgi:hypothetical protein